MNGSPTSPTSLTPSAPLAGRLASLDAYRGFIMLAMVSAGLGMAKIRNNPDYPNLSKFANQLEHVKWDEPCTFWDLIQPSFMFMVGVSMPFAFAKRREAGESWGRQFLHVVKRSLLLIAIGILMDSFKKEWPVIQFIRVLQQIAIGYFIAFLVLNLGPRGQAVAAIALLAGHTFAFGWYGGENAWSFDNRETNFGRELDRRMQKPFLEMGYQDILPLSPGFYVTFNAISSAGTILIGVLIGELLRCSWSTGRKALIIALAAAAFFCLGWLAQMAGLPMVKKIWTASFALYAAGWTCSIMLVFYLIIDVIGLRGWAWPFKVVGVNSIFIYVTSGILVGTIRDLLKPFVHLESIPDLTAKQVEEWSPVVMACLVLFIQWLLCVFLYRHRVFFKV